MVEGGGGSDGGLGMSICLYIVARGLQRPLKEAWTNPDIDSEERFLRDYLVHKQYDTEGDVDG